MKLTIAIPSYNKEKYIDRCLKSVLAEKDYIEEIVLVDNCSTDKTFELAKKYEPAIKCVQNSSNLGMSGNFNRCIDLCKTDLLMIFHADDELLPGAVKKYLEFFKKYPEVGLVYADHFYLKEGDLKTKEYMKADKKIIRRAGVEALEMPGLACSTVVVKKSVYDSVGYFIESISADFEMWRRIARYYDVGYRDAPTAIVHLNSASSGPASLRTVPIKEIEADWKGFSDRIISYYPLSMCKLKEKEARKGMIDGFIAVFAANLKAGQYKRALAAMNLIFFKYKGFWQILSRGVKYIRYKIKMKYANKGI